MKESHRAKRMNRRHSRKAYAAPIMLTSLMDIFTVLVVFLLASTSSGQQLPNNKFIKLPESTAIKQPAETLVIQVSDESIIVQGRKVASVKDVLASDQPDIPALVQELDYRAHVLAVTTGDTTLKSQKIKIMGDQHIPFSLLKKVMVSCTETIYTKISFAVLMKAEKSG
jgi:biopolymer transport protein ExbD